MVISEMKEAQSKEVIALLKTTLGDGSAEKTIEYWNWKHIQSPFGKSKVLLAFDDRIITGVRAFMKWQWHRDNEVMNSVRAVDTATLPGHQGKGIFKTLTLEAIDHCITAGDSFVFNTPNKISKQGYLKMGWSEAGRLPVNFGFGSVSPRFYSDAIAEELVETFSCKREWEKNYENWSTPSSKIYWHTAIDAEYVKWRYVECPVVKYGAVIESDKFGIIFRLKKIKAFIELRICEVWISPEKDAQKEASEAVKKICKHVRPLFVSCAPSPFFNSTIKKICKTWGPFTKGPETTIRSLVTQDLTHFHQFHLWKPSLGSMELF